MSTSPPRAPVGPMPNLRDLINAGFIRVAQDGKTLLLPDNTAAPVPNVVVDPLTGMLSFGQVGGRDLINDTVSANKMPESVLAKMRRLARHAQTNGIRALGVMATPPTVTANGTSQPAGQSNAYFHSVFPGFAKVYGGTIYLSGSYYGRVKSATIWTAGGNIGANDGSQASYSRIEFMADANAVSIMVNRSAAAYRFLVNDQYVSAAGTLTLSASPTSTTEYITLDFTSAGGRAVRKITVEMQGDNTFEEVHVGTTETVFPVDSSDVLRSVLLGDSYASGSDATALGDGFGAVMADWLGIRSNMNSGSGGTGWATTGSAYRFDQRITNGDLGLNGTPDIIFMMGSVNDSGKVAATITANCLAGMQAARAAYPVAPIFVFGTFPENTGPSAAIIAVENAVSAAVTAFADSRTAFIPISTDANGVWISGTGKIGSTTGTGNSDVYTDSGGVHPPTVGHAFIGKRCALAVLTASTAMT